MKNLYKKILNCTKCKGTLHVADTGMQPAIMMDNIDTAKIIFVAQNPGVPLLHEKNQRYEEVLMQSRIGKLFIEKFLQACRLQYKDIYWTNLLKCPTEGNRIPITVELDNCFIYLIEQINKLKNIHTIVLLGNTVKEYYNTYKLNTFSEKYNVIDFYHPAYIYRTGAYGLIQKLCDKIDFQKEVNIKW